MLRRNGTSHPIDDCKNLVYFIGVICSVGSAHSYECICDVRKYDTPYIPLFATFARVDSFPCAHAYLRPEYTRRRWPRNEQYSSLFDSLLYLRTLHLDAIRATRTFSSMYMYHESKIGWSSSWDAQATEIWLYFKKLAQKLIFIAEKVRVAQWMWNTAIQR